MMPCSPFPACGPELAGNFISAWGHLYAGVQNQLKRVPGKQVDQGEVDTYSRLLCVGYVIKTIGGVDIAPMTSRLNMVPRGESGNQPR